MRLRCSRFLITTHHRKIKKVMKFTWLKRFYNGLSAIFVRRQFLQVLGRLKQVQLGLKE